MFSFRYDNIITYLVAFLLGIWQITCLYIVKLHCSVSLASWRGFNSGKKGSSNVFLHFLFSGNKLHLFSFWINQLHKTSSFFAIAEEVIHRETALSSSSKSSSTMLSFQPHKCVWWGHVQLGIKRRKSCVLLNYVHLGIKRRRV